MPKANRLTYGDMNIMGTSSSDAIGDKIGAIILVLQVSMCLMTARTNQFHLEVIPTAQALVLDLVICLGTMTLVE